MDDYGLWIVLGALALWAVAALVAGWRRRARRDAAPADAPTTAPQGAWQPTETAAWLESEHQATAEAVRLEAERRAAAEQAELLQAQHQVAEDLARLEAIHRAEEATRLHAAHEAEHRATEQAARLRAEQQAAALVEQAAAPVVAPTAPRRTPEQTLILVADDSRVVRVKTSRLLARHRYRVVLAEDGLDAMRKIEDETPQVLITDVEMPGMDGFELARQVRSHARTAHIPIIMITSADDRLQAAAAAAGVTVLLGKPYPEDELIARIEQAQQAQQAAAAPAAGVLVAG